MQDSNNAAKNPSGVTPQKRYKCALCGRSRFDRPYVPHKCNGGFRKKLPLFSGDCVNESEDPKGYQHVWRVDANWKLGTSYTKCRMPRCPERPIAEFNRYSFALGRSRAYAYCEDHLYGRRIMDGAIKQRVQPDAA